MKKLTVVILILVLACTMVAAAGAKETGDEKTTIGLSLYDTKIQYFVSMEKGVREYCAEMGYDVIVHDEKSDETAMVSGITDLINQGVDALLVSPFKPEALGPVATLADQKGIPFIILDIGNGNGAYPYDAFIVSDNIAGGRLAGEYLIEKFNEQGRDLFKTKTAVITIDPSNVANHSRGIGFVDVMEENGVSVVSNIYAKEATADATYPVAKSILTANPDIIAIFCSNDDEAIGASQAAIDSGRRDLLVIGFDGQENAVEAIQNGSIMASVKQYPSEMGKLGVQLAIKKINGETLEYDDAATKTVYSPLKVIDKNNL